MKRYILLTHRDMDYILNTDLNSIPIGKLYDMAQLIQADIKNEKVDITKIKGELICIFQRFLWAVKIVKNLKKTEEEFAIDALLNYSFDNIKDTYILKIEDDEDKISWSHCRSLSTLRTFATDKKQRDYAPIVINADLEKLYKTDHTDEEEIFKCFNITHDDFFTNDQETIDKTIMFCIETASSIITMMSFLGNCTVESNDSIKKFCSDLREFNLLNKTEEQIKNYMDSKFKFACEGYTKNIKNNMNLKLEMPIEMPIVGLREVLK